MNSGRIAISSRVRPRRIRSITFMSHRYPLCSYTCSRDMSSGISGSVVKWRCESVFDASSTARRPLFSMARLVACPSLIICCWPISLLK